MMISWWSKHIGVILNVLMCDIWINVLLYTSALVGPLNIVNWNARWNSEIRNYMSYKLKMSDYNQIWNGTRFCFHSSRNYIFVFEFLVTYCRTHGSMTLLQMLLRSYAVIKHNRGIHFPNGPRYRVSRTPISVPLHTAEIWWSLNKSAVVVCSFCFAAYNILIRVLVTVV
jgi:hypothetical protein